MPTRPVPYANRNAPYATMLKNHARYAISFPSLQPPGLTPRICYTETLVKQPARLYPKYPYVHFFFFCFCTATSTGTTLYIFIHHLLTFPAYDAATSNSTLDHVRMRNLCTHTPPPVPLAVRCIIRECFLQRSGHACARASLWKQAAQMEYMATCKTHKCVTG
jgi:hypothetical protein